METAPDRKKVPIPTNNPLATTCNLKHLASHLTTLYLQQKNPTPSYSPLLCLNYFLQVSFYLVIIHYLHMLWSFHREFIFSLQRSFLVRRYFPQSTGSSIQMLQHDAFSPPAFYKYFFFFFNLWTFKKSNFKLEPSKFTPGDIRCGLWQKKLKDTHCVQTAGANSLHRKFCEAK